MRSLYHLYQGYKGIKGGNLYISFCVFFLSILSLSSCSPTKQISYKGEQGVKWEVYNSFSFLPVECGEVPASINSSIIQCIQEGIIQEMDKKGYGYTEDGTNDLVILLRIYFRKSSFVNANDMNAYVKSAKYTASSMKKKGNYFKEGDIEIEIFDAGKQVRLWSSHIRGFVNSDGSEVMKEKKIGKQLPEVLFKHFPKTRKLPVSYLKKREQEKLDKANEKEILYY